MSGEWDLQAGFLPSSQTGLFRGWEDHRFPLTMPVSFLLGGGDQPEGKRGTIPDRLRSTSAGPGLGTDLQPGRQGEVAGKTAEEDRIRKGSLQPSFVRASAESWSCTYM